METTFANSFETPFVEVEHGAREAVPPVEARSVVAKAVLRCSGPPCNMSCSTTASNIFGLDPKSLAMSFNSCETVRTVCLSNPDPWFINPLPLMGIIIGILIFRSLKGGGLLIMGLH